MDDMRESLLIVNTILLREVVCHQSHLIVMYHRRDSLPYECPFDLVHCDVWRSTRVTSILDHHYYMVLINDFSQAS